MLSYAHSNPLVAHELLFSITHFASFRFLPLPSLPDRICMLHYQYKPLIISYGHSALAIVNVVYLHCYRMFYFLLSVTIFDSLLDGGESGALHRRSLPNNPNFFYSTRIDG